MLNPFPIQFLALLAYFLLRVFVGGALVYLGVRHWHYRDELRHVLRLSWWPFGYFSAILFAATELIIGAMFIFGYYTQIAALIGIVLSLKLLVLRRRFDHHTIPHRLFYLMLLGACLSLFITGAGALAFDLPI